MFGSTKLGRFFGIDLYVHGTFWLLPLFILMSGVMAGSGVGVVFDLALIFAIFGCVALHEVGHALAARYYGVQTRDITLYPVGGVASLERMPERPIQEIVIALAGPAVNLVIAIGLLAGMIGGNLAFPGSFSLSGMDASEQLVLQLFGANVALLLFNLLPAFPMDGGRVLRAVLSLGMPRVDATRAAVVVGSIIAIGFGLIGLGLLPMPLTGERDTHLGLVLIAGVVFFLGQAELAGVRMQEARRQRRHRDSFFDMPYETADLANDEEAFTGWRWDPTRRVWSEWRDGVKVREVVMD
jgi:Zn-dependent protease